MTSNGIVDSINKIKELLERNCSVKKVYPQVFGSDAETNIVTVELECPDGTHHKIRAYGENAQAVREFLRTREL
ncbi:MAG TPA: hypothetical protein VH415_03960 [Nitrososphaeraceae archaeon]|jgi:hypothetical protein